MKIALSLGFVLCSFHLLLGQYQIGLAPRISPDQSVSQKIGLTEVAIEYSSPAVKNRTLLGEVIPYDQIWRAGANNATTIAFSRPVNIEGMTLDSGQYAFFLLPQLNKKWIAIFNKIDQQWGAFEYDEKEDALRVEVLPRRTNLHAEQLTYSIEQLGFEFGRVLLHWGNLKIEVPFETNYTEEFIKEVEKKALLQPDYIKWVVYIQGAEHLEQINTKLDLAKDWISQAEALMNITTEWNKQFYPKAYVIGHLYWVKAQLMARSENFAEAAALVEKLKHLEPPLYYQRRNGAEGIDVALEKWLGK